jgi:hypothetical protein
MATQVIEVRDADGGCAVRFFPDGGGAAARLRERCAARGWRAGEPAASADPGLAALTVAVRGATAAQLRAELEGDPSFDLSCCRPAEAPRVAGERAPSHDPGAGQHGGEPR